MKRMTAVLPSWVLTTLSLLTLGLGPAGCDTDQDTSNDEQPLSVEEANASLVEATCGYYVRCGLAQDQASCLATRAVAVHAELANAVGNGSVTIDQAALDDCLARIDARTCDLSAEGSYLGAYDATRTCDAMYVGTVALGGACNLAEQCESGYCEGLCEGACCEGQCAPTPYPHEIAIGASCAANPYGCVKEGFCNEAALCEARAIQGEACGGVAPFDSCAYGLVCASGVCAAPAPAGGDCSDLPCGQINEVCVDGTCVPWSGEGASCGGLSDPPCLLDLYCTDTNGSADPTGICVAAGAEIGTACAGDGQCATGYCDASGTCAALLANGESCDGRGEHCASGSCSVDGVCDDALVCVAP